MLVLTSTKKEYRRLRKSWVSKHQQRRKTQNEKESDKNKQLCIKQDNIQDSFCITPCFLFFSSDRK